MGLKELRKAAQYTQIELRDASGITQGGISAIERGQTQYPLHDTLVALAAALSKRLGRTVSPAEIAPRKLRVIKRAGAR